jgi:WD40 repeat protein
LFTTGVASSSSAASSPASSQLRSSSEKSRSTSRSRTPASSLVSSGSSSKHSPVKRLSKPNLISPSLSGSTIVSEADSETSRSFKIGGGAGERLAYLLLGQEEYQEHNSEVTQCKFSSSGYTIASSDVDGVVKVWSASPGPPHTYATFVSQSGVSALDWLPNSDRRFIYGTMNGQVRICDKDERKATCELATAIPCNTFIKQVVCSPTGNLCAVASESDKNEKSDSGILMLYDLKTSQLIENNLTQALSSSFNSSTTVTSCVFNHNAQMIITGNSDGKVRIFDLRKRDCISSWSLSETAKASSQVLTLQMSSDETSIYALSSEGQFSAWSFIQTSQKLFETKLEDPYFTNENYPRAAWGKQFAFAGDGNHVLTCSVNGGVIYEMVEENGEKKLEKVLGLKGHRRHATCTDWSASNDCGPCVTAGFDGQIRISTLLSQ